MHGRSAWKCPRFSAQILYFSNDTTVQLFSKNGAIVKLFSKSGTIVKLLSKSGFVWGS